MLATNTHFDNTNHSLKLCTIDDSVNEWDLLLLSNVSRSPTTMASSRALSSNVCHLVGFSNVCMYAYKHWHNKHHVFCYFTLNNNGFSFCWNNFWLLWMCVTSVCIIIVVAVCGEKLIFVLRRKGKLNKAKQREANHRLYKRCHWLSGWSTVVDAIVIILLFAKGWTHSHGSCDVCCLAVSSFGRSYERFGHFGKIENVRVRLPSRCTRKIYIYGNVYTEYDFTDRFKLKQTSFLYIWWRLERKVSKFLALNESGRILVSFSYPQFIPFSRYFNISCNVWSCAYRMDLIYRTVIEWMH